jgi:hypothetical protein
MRNCGSENFFGKYFFQTFTYGTFAVWTSCKAFLTDAVWYDERCVTHLRSLKFDFLPYPVCGRTALQLSIMTDVGRVGRLRKGQKICLCFETSEPAVVPTQPHIQCVLRLKRPGRDADCLHLLQWLIRGPICQFFLTHSWRGAKLTH